MVNNKEYPLISIIVPTFERSELLPRALDSIFAQTWKNIEVIVVDDNLPGSPFEEKTREVLKSYQDKENFFYLKTEGKTGVEMEALTGVSVALLTIYDMCKAMDRSMQMKEIHLVEKDGGKSGHYIRQKSL